MENMEPKQKSPEDTKEKSNIINPDSILNKLTDEEIAALDEKDEYYKGQD